MLSKAEEWSAIIADWRESGLSCAEYCRRKKYTLSTFYCWKEKEDKKRSTVPVKAIRVGNTADFIAGSRGSGVHLLVRGIQIELSPVFSSDVLSQVLEVIKQC